MTNIPIYALGVVKDIIHDKGRGAPLARIQFKDAYRYQRVDTLISAVEGLYTGQFVYSGKRGKLMFQMYCSSYTSKNVFVHVQSVVTSSFNIF